MINVSMVAINSHAILPIARECARRDGDLRIIYVGDNEVVGPFGASGVFSAKAPPLAAIRASLALKTTRLGQLLDAGWQRLRNGTAGQPEWLGMLMFKETVGRDDPSIARVHANFRANLEAILKSGQQASIPIVLSTVAVNLREFPPFAALPARDTAAASASDLPQQAAAATAAQTAGNWAGAIQAYERALTMAPAHADIEFRLGLSTRWIGSRGRFSISQRLSSD